MDDSVRIKCFRCKGLFRLRARKLTSGYSCQCPSCEAVLFFDDASPKQEIKDAMKAAQSMRRALREEADALIVARKPFVFSRSS